MVYKKYQPFIQDNFTIIDKHGQEVPFIFNAVQNEFVNRSTGRDIVLKARQEGFSSEILAVFSTDFLLKENSLSVVIADIADNAQDLLGRVKHFLRSYERKNEVKIPLKYNSRYELYNAAINSRYIIGTAENTQFGRSKTITNLHMSEAAFYKHLNQLLAGAGTALVPDGKFVIESTANGFNEFKTLWDSAVLQENDFNTLFFNASGFYPADFLESEKKRLGRLYSQEYPETAEEAFITSGDTYFDKDAMKYYLESIKDVSQISQMV